MKKSEKELKEALQKLTTHQRSLTATQMRDPNFVDKKLQELLNELERCVTRAREENQRLEDKFMDEAKREIKPIKLNMEEE
jgi:hypothetical protein